MIFFIVYIFSSVLHLSPFRITIPVISICELTLLHTYLHLVSRYQHFVTQNSTSPATQGTHITTPPATISSPRYFSTLGRYTLSASPRGLVDALPSLRAPRSQLRFSSSAPSLILRRDKTFQAFDMQMRLHFLVTLSHRDEEAATGKVRGNFSVARGRLPAASSLRLLSH